MQNTRPRPLKAQYYALQQTRFRGVKGGQRFCVRSSWLKINGSNPIFLVSIYLWGPGIERTPSGSPQSMPTTSVCTTHPHRPESDCESMGLMHLETEVWLRRRLKKVRALPCLACLYSALQRRVNISIVYQDMGHRQQYPHIPPLGNFIQGLLLSLAPRYYLTKPHAATDRPQPNNRMWQIISSRGPKSKLNSCQKLRR